MKTITILEFRKNARKMITRLQQGEKMIMTYRGKPICIIEPINDDAPKDDDLFYSLTSLADNTGEDISNKEIDEIVYGK